MKLSEIRLEVQDLVNDPEAERFPQPRVDRAIVRAYKDVVTLVEKIPEAYNVVRTPTIYTLEAGDAREWSLMTAQPLCRGVIDVADWDPTDSVYGARRNLIPWSQRNDATASERDCYVFRDEAADWYMGTVMQDRSETEYIAAWFRAPMGVLTSEDDVPLLVPPDHQSTISAKAAILLMQQVNRELGAVPALYLERLANLKEHITGALKPKSHRRTRPI